MTTSTGWSAKLFNRYHRLDKHYSSYPALEYFQQPISAFERYSALRTSRTLQSPLALHITIPFCANACYSCTQKTTVTKDRSRSTAYLQSLEQEVRMVAQHIRSNQPITELYVSGGTPTFLNSPELRQMMRCLQDHFTLVSDNFSHYSIDIDPRETDWATMGVLRDIGFNCINIMVHALDPAVQRAINRLHSLEQTQKIVEAARTLQFRNICISLVYGLPKQTLQSWILTLTDMLKLAPDRIHLQGFQHQPDKYPLQQRIAAHDLPCLTDIADMLQVSIDHLAQAGYQYMGMGNFALVDDDFAIAQEDGKLQYALHGYSTQSHSDTLGLGAGATSKLGELYYRNTQDVAAYQSACHNKQLPTAYGVLCSAQHSIRADVIQTLNCQLQIDFRVIEQRYKINFKEYFQDQWPQLQRMHDDGLLQFTEHGLHMTAQGRLFTLAVCQVFDEYFTQANTTPTALTQVM